jgi:hypothetical protein
MRGPGAVPWHYQGDTMKKTPKKLVLAKETVRNLEEMALRKAGGGYSLEASCPDASCVPYRCPNMPASARC